MIPMLRNCSLGPSGVLVREDWSSTASLASSADTTLITAAKSAMTTNIVLAPETIWPRRVVRTREGTREVEHTRVEVLCASPADVGCAAPASSSAAIRTAEPGAIILTQARADSSRSRYSPHYAPNN